MGEMPSETIIQGADNRFTVQWAKEGSLDPTVILTDWTAETDPAEESTTWTPAGSVYVLDRNGINRLIRVLRRARDQAYGLDE